MARKNSFFDRLLDLIGLAEDETPDKEEKSSTASRQRASSDSYSSRSKSADDNPYSRSSQRSSYSSGYSRSGSYSSQNSASSSRFSSGYSGFERKSASGNDRDQDIDELEQAFARSSDGRQEQRYPSRTSSTAPAQRQTNVRPRPQAQSSAPRTPNSMRMRYVQMHNLADSRGVIKDMISGYTMVVNLDDMDDRLVQRCIDTLGGAACALGADLRSASDRTYMIAPIGVEFDYQTNYSADNY